MNTMQLSDGDLNMFVDGQQADQEAQQIREAMLSDPQLRERVCQLKAVRELISYAYSDAPRSDLERRVHRNYRHNIYTTIAASILLVLGTLIGWYGHNFSAQSSAMVNSREVFEYFAKNMPVSHVGRKIVIHVSTGNLLALKKTLDETEQLYKSYRAAGVPLSIDIVTNKGGINLLRVGVTPYANRIAQMTKKYGNIQFFACSRSIAKEKKREGRDIVMLPEAHIARSARDIIPALLDKGWIYIKV